MKRCIVKLAVFLLLGAIVNVAVAWGCAYASPYAIFSHRPPSRGETRWLEGLHERPTGETSVFAGFGIRNTHLTLDDPEFYRTLRAQHDLGTFVLPDAQILESGFPFKALVSFHVLHTPRWHTDQGLPAQNWTSEEWGGRLLPKKEFIEPDRSIAWRPTLVGFAIDSVFYAVALRLLFAAPAALRRKRRIKRGLCPKCAYDLRGCASQNCPECGTEVIKQKAETQKAEMS